LNRARLRLVKSLFTWLLLPRRRRLVNGLRAIDRHILNSALDAACQNGRGAGEQDSRGRWKKTFDVVSFHQEP
jgi:hypothetical protein